MSKIAYLSSCNLISSIGERFTYLGEHKPQMDQMDSTENNKHEIIFPADLRLSSCCEIDPENICEEKGGKRV